MNDEEWAEDERPKPADERYREIGQARIQEIREQLKENR